MNTPPIGYRPLAWLGVVGNVIGLILSLLCIVITSVSDPSLSSNPDNIFNSSATEYFYYLLSIPLSCIGILISFKLILRKLSVLNVIRKFFVASIVVDISAAITELKFNLDATESSFYELAYSALFVFINAAILFYWDRDTIKDYLISNQARK